MTHSLTKLFNEEPDEEQEITVVLPDGEKITVRIPVVSFNVK